MLDGRMRHKDNHGHEGVMVPGSVQWMTAGRGIVHSEMPEQQEGRMRGFQLWINLPAKDKMTEPKYQEFGPEKIPVTKVGTGVSVKVIAGRVGDTVGPIAQPATDPTYLDVALEPGASFSHVLPFDHSAFLFVYEGYVRVGTGEDAATIGTHQLAVLGNGAEIRLEGREAPAGAHLSRAILGAGKPLREPVAKYGPFVMNTRDELIRAVEDFNAGKF
jgi:redox-sensitive bicupin YhaK (pirin superfamily)